MPSRARGGRAHVELRPASLVGPRSLEPGSCRAGLVGAALLGCGRQVSVEPHAWSRAQAERGLCSGRAGPPAEPHPVGPGSWGWTARGGAGPIGRTGVPAVPGRGLFGHRVAVMGGGAWRPISGVRSRGSRGVRRSPPRPPGGHFGPGGARQVSVDGSPDAPPAVCWGGAVRTLHQAHGAAPKEAARGCNGGRSDARWSFARRALWPMGSSAGLCRWLPRCPPGRLPVGGQAAQYTGLMGPCPRMPPSGAMGVGAMLVGAALTGERSDARAWTRGALVGSAHSRGEVDPAGQLGGEWETPLTSPPPPPP